MISFMKKHKKNIYVHLYGNTFTCYKAINYNEEMKNCFLPRWQVQDI